MESNRHLKLLFVCCLSFLVLFQGRWAVSRSFGMDESCYIEYLHRFIGEPVWTCFSKDQMKGVSVLWIPVGLFVKLFAHALNQPFTDWVLPFLGLTSFLQWVVSVFLLDKTFCLLAKSQSKEGRWPFFWTFILAFSLPMTAYAFRTSYFSHAAELFLTSLLFYCVTTNRWAVCFICTVMLAATRLNDVLIVLPLFAILYPKLKKNLNPQMKKLLIVGGSFSLLAAAFFFIKVAFFTGYNGYYLSHVVEAIQWKGVPKALFEHNHGLFWHNFIWLFCLGFLTFRLRSISNLGRGVWLWQVGLFILYVSVTVFWGFAEDRFLLASYIALYWYLYAERETLPLSFKKAILVLLPLNAVWNLWAYAAEIAPVLRGYQNIYGQVASNMMGSLGLLLHPQFVFTGLAGLSPVGFTVFSWWSDHPFFARYSEFAKYTIQGPSLWVLTVFTISVLGLFIYLSIQLFRTVRKDEDGPLLKIKRMLRSRQCLPL